MEHLYGWIFTYYPLEGKWAACKVEDLPTLRNDYSTEKAILSSSVDTLQVMIMRGKGELESMKKLAKK